MFDFCQGGRIPNLAGLIRPEVYAFNAALERNIMLFRLIGKRLFPRAHPWEQKQKVRMMFFVLLASLVAAGSIGMMIYKHGR